MDSGICHLPLEGGETRSEPKEVRQLVKRGDEEGGRWRRVCAGHVRGFLLRNQAVPSGTVSQVLEVEGHVRNPPGPTEVGLRGLGHRSATQGKGKKVTASQNNKS